MIAQRYFFAYQEPMPVEQLVRHKAGEHGKQLTTPPQQTGLQGRRTLQQQLLLQSTAACVNASAWVMAPRMKAPFTSRSSFDRQWSVCICLHHVTLGVWVGARPLCVLHSQLADSKA